MVYEHIKDLIGNTPLLKIDPSVHGLKHIELYAKLEYYNPFGSVKDRVAKGLLEPFLPEIKEKGKTVIEASSGNTGKALAALCSVEGVPTKIMTNRIKLDEFRLMLQALGAEIDELPGFSDCPDPNDPNDLIATTERLAASQPDTYHLADQYKSPRNPQAHYETTGKEIYDDVGAIDYFIGGLGTCGTTQGAGKYLKEKNPDTKVVGVVAKEYHYAPGLRTSNELWDVGLFDRHFFTAVLDGTTMDGADGMMELIRKCGMLCGPSSGLNYKKALEYLKKIDETLPDTEPKKKAVFIACDRFEPYLSYLQKYKPELFSGSTKKRPLISALSEDEAASGERITVSELEKRIEDPNTLIIDMRGIFGYAVGHIRNSVCITDYLLTDMIESGNVFPKEKTIVVVCRVGELSPRYAAFLKKAGYTAYSLEGGVSAWRSEGKELVKE